MRDLKSFLTNESIVSIAKIIAYFSNVTGTMLCLLRKKWILWQIQLLGGLAISKPVKSGKECQTRPDVDGQS